MALITSVYFLVWGVDTRLWNGSGDGCFSELAFFIAQRQGVGSNVFLASVWKIQAPQKNIASPRLHS